MSYQELKLKAKEKFPVEREIEETEDRVFLRGELLKQSYHNDYCYIRLHRGRCEISFFKSDSRQFEKIEDDFLNDSIDFRIEESDYTKAQEIFNWIY